MRLNFTFNEVTLIMAAIINVHLSSDRRLKAMASLLTGSRRCFDSVCESTIDFESQSSVTTSHQGRHQGGTADKRCFGVPQMVGSS